MKRVGVCALLILALTACGDGSDREEMAPPATEAAEAPMRPVPIAAAEEVARSRLSRARAVLRQEGADLVGDPDVRCAPTGGPETECQIEIPYRRLKACAIARWSIFVADRGTGPETLDEREQAETEEQVCYIGADGEPVPEKP